MLYGRLLHAPLQLGKAFTDLLDPHVPAQDSQGLRHRLEERFRGNLHRVLSAGEVTTGDQAGTQGHAKKNIVRLLFASLKASPKGRSSPSRGWRAVRITLAERLFSNNSRWPWVSAAPLLGRVASGGCWRGVAAGRRGTGISET